jgi:hypothetical protein
MHIETNGKTISVLIDLYNKEIDTLKSKLLNGIPWEELLITRENITNLAVAIHKTYDHKKADHEDTMPEIKKRGEEIPA